MEEGVVPIADSFAAQVRPLVKTPEPPIALALYQSAPLAHLDYLDELKVKNGGLNNFWEKHKLPGRPEPIIASPRPRGYRTTSKRKASLRGTTLHLQFGDKSPLPQKGPFLASPLEPPEHEDIYRFLQGKLSEPAYKLLAVHLNYLIIRGSYSDQAVIFNVDMMNGPLVRKLKMLAEHLRKQPKPVTAAFAFLDPSRSDYYLESKRPDTMNFKKLFGPDQLTVSHGGCRYQFHPTSFSQVNESMVPVMLDAARELLAPKGGKYLLDLYCGYGLFSHFLAADYRKVLAIDAEGPSIRAAEANGRLNAKHGKRARFLARRITGKLLDEMFSESAAPDAVLLDPPRQGTQPGVIANLCHRRPGTVLHIFCGVDQIPAALKEWQANGYKVKRVVPLDMFPGTINLEVLVLLTPAGK